MKPQSVEKLSQVYESVEDIDLFTGGLAEKPVSGGIVGPTFGCLIGQQFLNLKIGEKNRQILKKKNDLDSCLLKILPL